MSLATLVQSLAENGLQLRKNAGRLQIVGKGEIPSALAEQIRWHRDALLAVALDPVADIDRLRREAIEQTCHIMPRAWFGTAAEWGQFDEIDARFAQAKEHADTATARQCHDDYIALARCLTEETEKVEWAMTCGRCEFDNNTEHNLCSVCEEQAGPASARGS